MEWSKKLEVENKVPNKIDGIKHSETDKIFKGLFASDFVAGDKFEYKFKYKENQIDTEEAYNSLFESDMREDSENKITVENDKAVDLTKQYEPNSKFEVEDNTYETDDNGMIFKINGKELVPNCEYTIGDVTYKTDDKGRIISCDGYAKQTPEGTRDQKAQEEAGGEDRREKDQGGHILARILGGSEGIENMLAMRGTINQGPYKSMENEINKALSEGKEVHVHVEVKYEGDSKRPSKIEVTYTIDGKETTIEYDNDEGSIDLLESVEEKVDNDQYNDLKQEIEDANEDGGNISIIAVKTEYDHEGNIEKVTVTMRDENNGGPNEKRILLPKEGV